LWSKRGYQVLWALGLKDDQAGQRYEEGVDG
jgi:hypothetical protein